jgi:TRAP-type mannitol/chloroaromatic compound transport system permease small subunit
MPLSFKIHLRRVQSALDAFAESTGNLVAWLVFLIMAVTAIVVFIRYLLNGGSIALQESITYLHGVVFLLAIAYALKRQSHVRVDIFYQKFSTKTRALIDLAGTFLFLFPFSIFILWVSYEYVFFSWKLLEGSAEPGGLPGVFLLKSLIPLMGMTLLLQGIAEAIKCCLIIYSDQEAST